MESALLLSPPPTNSQKQNTRIYMLLGKTYIEFLIQDNKNRKMFREKGNGNCKAVYHSVYTCECQGIHSHLRTDSPSARTQKQRRKKATPFLFAQLCRRQDRSTAFQSCPTGNEHLLQKGILSTFT